MQFSRVLLTGGICFLFTVGLEFWAYPWAIYFGNFTYGFGITLFSYLIVALVVSLVASAATFSRSLYGSVSAISQALIAGASILTVLIALALIFGPFGIDIPGTRASGIFFSEWKFITFTSEVSVPVAVLAGIIAWIGVRRQQRILHAPMR